MFRINRSLIDCREEFRYNVDAVECLIHNQLVIVPQYDQFVAHLVDAGSTYMTLGFAMQLVQRFCTDNDKHGPRAAPDVSVFLNVI